MRVYWDKLTHFGNEGAMRAAAEVAIRWGREDQKEKDAEICEHYANVTIDGELFATFIRNQKG